MIMIFMAFLILLLQICSQFLTFIAFRRQLHMFQLNGYKCKTHSKWLRGRAELKSSLILIICALALVVGRFLSFADSCQIFSLIAICVILILNMRSSRKIPVKKPLVYTARVKRMIITYFVMLALALFLSIALTRLSSLTLPTKIINLNRIPSAAMPVSAVFSAIFAFLPIIINAINFPMESLIRRWYINDAKKVLATYDKLIVIGITGSFGKTSVKNYLARILKERYSVLMTPESYNTPMGVVKTIREQLKPTHQIFICEMGARNVGDIKELCDIVHPQIGIITSIGEQHLESFKTVENIIKTKMELATAIAKSNNSDTCPTPQDNAPKRFNALFLNDDCPLIAANIPDMPFVPFGMKNAANLRVLPSGTMFDFIGNNDDSSLKSIRIDKLSTVLIGETEVLNLTGAISVALTLRLSPEEIRRGVTFLKPVPHRRELKRPPGMTIIDDAYNSNPAGCKAALNTLSLIGGMKILITPGMVELGAREYELNKEFGIQAAGICDYCVLVGKKRTEPIYEGLKEAGFANDNIIIKESFSEGFAFIRQMQGEKTVLIENDLPDNY